MILSTFVVLVAALVALDIGMKDYVEEHKKEGEEESTCVEELVLRKTYNRGFLLNSLEDKKYLVKWSTISSIVGILLYDLSLFFGKKKRILSKFGMVFATAGMISNGYDRLIRGKVIDYIGLKKEVKSKKITLNLADLYLVFGFFIYVLTRIGKIIRGK